MESIYIALFQLSSKRFDTHYLIYLWQLSTLDGDYRLRGVKNTGDDAFFLTTGSVFVATVNFCVIPDKFLTYSCHIPDIFLTTDFSAPAEDFSVQ